MAEATPSTGPFAVLSQASELWAKQPKRRKSLAIAIVVLVLGGVAYTTLIHHGETWVGLADGASPEDASELIATLQARDIPARLTAGKVEVPADRAGEARAIASSAGLPRAGKGFELFDSASLGQSSFAEQVNYRRALQGELARSIAQLAQVETARVHLALGKHSVFKDQEEPPSASVALHLHASQTLSVEQVRGVRQLVAASVEGLKPDAVVVLDQHGNLLDAGEASASDHKADIERIVTARVRTMLERVVGEGKASVVATADVDDRKTSETEEVYDKDHSVVRSESRTVEGPNATAGIGGVAGTQGNLPGAPAAAPTAGSGGAGKLAETKNYEVSRTVRQTQGASGTIKKLHLAVVVDYKLENGKSVPRTDKEIAELTALARQAAGIDDARGDSLELRTIAFAPDAETPVAAAAGADWTSQLPLPLPILAAAAGGLLLLILAVVAVLAIRGSRRRARLAHEATQIALPAPLADLERVLDARPQLGLAPPVAPNIHGAGSEHALPAGPPVQERVLAAVRSDVERAAAVLTSWLAEPPPKGAKP